MTSRNLWLATFLFGILFMAAANAHLLYVAVSSQPDCVEHSKSIGVDGRYRAAKSAC